MDVREFPVLSDDDGAPHNFLIETEDDEMLVRSDTITNSGSWQTVKFVASERMYQYYCQFHPLTMRGDVELVSEDELAERMGTTTTTAQTTTTPADTTTVTETTAGQAGIDAGRLVQRVRAPGFSTLTALAGLGGASYLFARRTDDE